MKAQKVSLDDVAELQDLIKSDAWRNDGAGALVSKALMICARAGASVDDALAYLEIADDERPAWREYIASRF